MEVVAVDREELEALQARIRATDPETIGRWIKEAREETFANQDALAKAIGSDRSHIIKLEKGYRRPHARTLLRIAAVTKRDPESFLRAEVGNGRPFRGKRPGVA